MPLFLTITDTNHKLHIWDDQDGRNLVKSLEVQTIFHAVLHKCRQLTSVPFRIKNNLNMGTCGFT